jgi:hypothetical protein
MNIIDGTEYVTINEFAKAFGLGHGSLKRNLEHSSIELLERNKCHYIKKEVLNQFVKESKQIIGFKEILAGLVKKLNSEVNPKARQHLNKLITYIAGNSYFGTFCVPAPVYKKYNSLNFYIYKKDKEILESGMTEYLLLFNKPYEVKINLLCEDVAFNDKQTTVKFIKEYIVYVNKDLLSAYVEAVNFLRLTSVKDLTLYTDNEISNYSKLASTEMTKAGCANLIGLYTYMQKNVKCKSNIVIACNKKSKEVITPYNAEKYIKLAYMVFNDEYWEKHNMIYKAITKERYAKTWFYHAMHYVCDWRRKDIIEEIPRITLEYQPEQILKNIESGIISENQYKKVCNEIAMKVNYKPERPNKIRRFKDAPPLRLHIPESFSSVIGMLAMVCEAHNQINGKKDSLCHMSHSSVDANVCIRFFGDEYNELFDGHKLSNIKANKSHLNMLSDTGDELGTDGYLIAHYARSHTGGINGLSDVTSRYLQAKMDGYSVDEITKSLFERGVCSFIPHLFCKLLKKNEFEKVGIKEQTRIMNNLQMKAFDIENLLKMEDEIAVSIKQRVAAIIQWVNEDNVNEMIKRALESIINGECIGKNESIYCLRKACGKECSAKCRETCVGCGYEMYVKAFVMELGNEIKFQERSLAIAKTQGEKIKRTAILEKKLYPTVCELLTTVKYVYGQDVEALKILFVGNDENGNARVD